MATVTKQKELVTYIDLDDGTREEQREPVFVYVHCFNQACGLYHDLQQDMDHERRVPGLRVESEFTCVDLGGDSPALDRSTVQWLPQDVQDTVCEECGEPVNVSEQPARKLAGQNIGPGMGLKGAERAAALAAAKVAEQNKGKDAELEDLHTQVADLTRLVKQQQSEPPKAA